MSVGRHIAPVRFLIFPLVLVAAAGAMMASGIDPRTAFLSGFDVAAFIFLCSLAPLLRADAVQMRRRAVENDANRLGLLAIVVLLSLVVLFAVGTLIASPGKLGRCDVILIIATLALAWLFANMVFTLHYAHLYYLQEGGRDRGGLEVPGVKEPGYWDFLYFSFTLGMTFQTSDTAVTTPGFRRLVTLHSLAAFLFNLGVVAFVINTLGSR